MNEAEEKREKENVNISKEQKESNAEISKKKEEQKIENTDEKEILLKKENKLNKDEYEKEIKDLKAELKQKDIKLSQSQALIVKLKRLLEANKIDFSSIENEAGNIGKNNKEEKK